MADYTTVDLVASAIGATSTDYTTLADAVTTASRLVDDYCGRQFGAGAAGVIREYQPLNSGYVFIDDASTVTAVKTDDTLDHTFGTSWTANTDYVLEPVNGVGTNGQTGWPYSAICAVGTRQFPTAPYWSGPSNYRNNTVQVTGTFGWAAVPSEVSMATLFLASEMFKVARDAPLGFAGMADFGPVQVRGYRRVTDLLGVYMTNTSTAGPLYVA